MKSKKEYTKEEVEAYLRAVMENEISKEDFQKEILLMFEEFFMAEFESQEGDIICNMLNGQKFKITIEEI